MKPLVMLYGVTKGNGSFARVTSGWRSGLSALGHLAGFCPIDQGEEGLSVDGADAPVAVYCGPPSGWEILTTGNHVERCVVLAPNSTWMPEKVIAALEQYATRCLAPSWWARAVLRPYLQDSGVALEVVQHGVDSIDKEAILRSRAPKSILRLDDTYFRALHLTTTSGQRKGTAELIAAWKLVAKDFPAKSELVIVADDLSNFESEWVGGTTIRVVPRANFALSAAEELYQAFDVVVQPSRAEGFGMVPLEAAACGVPTVLTSVTGHDEYISTIEGAVVVAADGRREHYAPIDDGPDALAPIVDHVAIADALKTAFVNRKRMQRRALLHAEATRHYWSWEAVLVRSGFIERIEDEFGGAADE